VEANRRETPVLALITDDWTHVHPDHAIDVVLDRFGRNPGVLPVLSRTDVEAVEGVITSDTLMRVFGARKTARATKTQAAPPPAEPPTQPPAPPESPA
jgi:hypothetical protein